MKMGEAHAGTFLVKTEKVMLSESFRKGSALEGEGAVVSNEEGDLPESLLYPFVFSMCCCTKEIAVHQIQVNSVPWLCIWKI